jgi:hypothetical protein
MIVLFALFSGCSTKTIALKNDEKTLLQNKTITFTNREEPKQISVMTPTKAIGLSGIVGFLDSLVLSFFDDNDQYNTTNSISSYANIQLVNRLKDKYHMKYIENNATTDQDNIDKLIKQYPNSDYLLDSKTTYWNLVYYPLHWGKYRVAMKNVLKLIDVKNKKIVAQKQCIYVPKYSDKTPTYDDFFANDGKLIKEATKKILDSCIEEFYQLL